MRKMISKIKKHLRNNQGSSLVLVIVALAFVGILMGALLTASMAVYRLKLYDYNAKDNFYYVEQAMDEVYAGVGNKTMENLLKAYDYTLEHLIQYNPETKEYSAMSNKSANKLFKNKFMEYLIGEDTFKNSSVKTMIESFISNPDIKVTNVSIKYYDKNNVPVTSAPDYTKLNKVVLKGVTLERSADYNRSQASGMFTQTIATDIVIARPPFNVNFTDSKTSTTDLFDYCIVADSGVEFNETPGNKISVSGDVYAASDFYNKRYNQYKGSYRVSADPYTEGTSNYTDTLSFKVPVEPIEISTDTDADEIATGTDASEDEKEYKVTMNKVSNYYYTGSAKALNNMYNHNAVSKTYVTDRDQALYDGQNERSMYSGFYINNNKVSLIAGKLIVPGTIAVMNTGELSVFGDGKGVGGTGSMTSIWADNMVLGGYVSSTGKGASVLLNANVFMKDDTSIESAGATYKLVGSYYGYSDGNEADVREFVPSTAKDAQDEKDQLPIYQEKGADGNIYTKGHYNSSAFIVNGEKATIDLSNARNIYLAGRSYIELSRQKTSYSVKKDQKVTGTDNTYTVTDETYQYNSDIKDYKTGESFAVSSGQFAYLPFDAPKPVFKKDDNGNTTAVIDHYESKLPASLQKSELFIKYFGAAKNFAETVPVTYQQKEVVMQDGSKKLKSYYYLDFDYVASAEVEVEGVKKKLYDETKFATQADTGQNMADILKTSFIRDYYYYLNFADDYLEDNSIFTADKSASDGTIRLGGKTYKHVDSIVLDEEEDLTDTLIQITDDPGFKPGEIKLPTSTTTSNIYASGTVAATLGTTAKDDLTYTVITGDGKIQSTLKKTDSQKSKNDTETAGSAKAFSKEYGQHYNYVKMTLGDIPENDPAAKFIDEKLMSDTSIYGEASITPINYYLNMDKIEESTNIDRTVGAGYRVIISYNDVHVTDSKSEEMTGIIVTKGDVYFDNVTPGSSLKTVKKFNGIIISGGKVYINGDVTNIASTTLCKKIFTECASLSKSGNFDEKKDADLVLRLFKGYESYVAEASADPTDTSTEKSISNLDYSDVVRYENWMKSVD